HPGDGDAVAERGLDQLLVAQHQAERVVGRPVEGERVGAPLPRTVGAGGVPGALPGHAGGGAERGGGREAEGGEGAAGEGAGPGTSVLEGVRGRRAALLSGAARGSPPLLP